MANPEPYWPWCPVPGATRTSQLAVDEIAFGDGYKHRTTRGLNPVRPSWSLAFPFATLAELDERDAFLRSNATAGFWITPPDSAAFVMVTADEWSATISDRAPKGDRLGVLTVVFVQTFNPQPPGG